MATKNKRPVAGIRNWKTLSSIFLAILLAIWLLLSGGAWLFIKYRRGFSEAQFADICLPHRWAQHQQKMGNFYISRARQLLEAGDFIAAGEYLRSGVARSPGNIGGQVLLAEFYAALGRADLAKALWAQNFDKIAQNPIHLQTALQFLLSIQEDQLVLEKATPLLKTPNSLPGSTRTLLGTYAANAALNLGDLAAAERLTAEFVSPRSVGAALISAKIEWERGYPALALQLLRAALLQFPREDAIRSLEVSFLRRHSLIDEWSTAVVERLVASPDQVEAHIEYFHLLLSRGQQERALVEAEKSIQRFQKNPAALLALADFAAKTGQPTIATRIQSLLNPSNPVAAPVALMRIEAHTVAGEFQTAVSLSSDYSKDWPALATQHAAVLHGLLAIAYNGLGNKDEARLQVGLLLNERNLRAENLIAVSSRLMAGGAPDLALETLVRAVKADPRNEAALTHLIQFQLEMDDITSVADFVPQFVAGRRPSPALAHKIAAKLGSDRYLLVPSQAAHLASLKNVMASTSR